jgi:hypothetical protein
MADSYKEGLSLYKLKKYKEALKKFGEVAKDHLKFGHAQQAKKRLTRQLSDEFPMKKHTAEERQKIKEDRSKNIDQYYEKVAEAAKKKKKWNKAKKTALAMVVTTPSEIKKK